jgi:hypothetical protein
MKVGLVACSAQKADRPCAAKDLYQGALFKKSMAYLKGRVDAWAILSAKYGLVLPERVIKPYNLTLNTMKVKERRAWTWRVKGQLLDVFPKAELYIVLAGERYRDALKGLPHTVPLRGLSIGKQLQWLTERLR